MADPESQWRVRLRVLVPVLGKAEQAGVPGDSDSVERGERPVRGRRAHIEPVLLKDALHLPDLLLLEAAGRR
jgi:hypothetical protein